MTLRPLAIGLLTVVIASFVVLPPAAEAAADPSTLNLAVAYLDARYVQDLADLDQPLTVSEAVRIAFDSNLESRKAVEHMRHAHARPAFSDVSVMSPFAPYARVALEQGLVGRNIDMSLRPNARIRAEEAIAILLGQKRGTGNEWFVPAVREALLKNIIADPRSLSVGGEITRGQFVDMAYRLEIIKEKNLVVFSPDAVRGPAAGTQVAVQQPDMPPIPTVLAAAPAGAETRMKYGSAKFFSITIPSLDIQDLTVTHPDDSVTRDGLLSVLDRGVGHLYAYPGRGGKVMIYGHSSDYAWINTPYTEIFARINELPAGAKIYVTHDGKTYSYTVTGQQVIDPDDTTPFEGDGEELILYTCWPPKSVDTRLIVRASPDQTVAVR